MAQIKVVSLRKAVETAKKNNREALKDFIRENGPSTCKAIAEANEMTSPQVRGLVCHCFNEEPGYRSGNLCIKGETMIRNRYAMIKADGTVDFDKTIVVGYKTAVYGIR
jgi:hypothetical protein